MTSLTLATCSPQEVFMFNRFRKPESEVLAEHRQPNESQSKELERIDAKGQEKFVEEVTDPTLQGPPPEPEGEVDSGPASEIEPASGEELTVEEYPNLVRPAGSDTTDQTEAQECDDELWVGASDGLTDQLPAQDLFDDQANEEELESQETPPPSKGSPAESFESGLRRIKKKPATGSRAYYTPQQRLLILDTWRRSGLPAADFADLVNVSKHTLYKWKSLFERLGPEGLMQQPKGRTGSRLSVVTKRTILMLKQAHPEWGVERISDMLTRGPALSASPSAILRVLRQAGYQSVKRPTAPNRPPKVIRFERAKPNQMWQTDFFTFMLKRQNRRLHLIAFMDDHSRFIVCYGLHASATTSLAIEAVEAGITNFGPPEEILTDNGPQYITWRGKSRFTRHLQTRGIKQIVARPKRPQTLGKIERFWGTLWRELLEGSVFVDLTDARTRLGHFIDYYNFQRPHRGINGLVPADRFFGAAQEVLETLQRRVAANSLELARHGKTKPPFYVTGQVSGQTFSVHSEGERLVLNREGQQREEIELAAPPQGDKAKTTEPSPVCPQGIVESGPGEPADEPPLAPGQSVIDQFDAEGLNDQAQEKGGQS
jgi:transposase InsO family protein